MGLFDIFKVKQFKAEIDRLNKELEDLKATFTPEMREAVHIKELIDTLNKRADSVRDVISQRNHEVDVLHSKSCELEAEINRKKAQIINLDEEIMLQDFGVYRPMYDFDSSAKYKKKLDDIRAKQKQLIKDGKAVTGNMNWTVDGNRAKGKKMVKDMQKLVLRAFNCESDELIANVKYNNFDTAVKRMDKSFEIILNLGTAMGVAITAEYYSLKQKELRLAFEYAKKKQDEKEEQKEIRARLREEAKLQKEIEEARKKISKEQTHYKNALAKVNAQLETASDSEREVLLEKKAEIEAQLVEIDKSIADIDYREANAKAGYVYIISNIGSFGENVYKIGMTRRLDPMERVDELGDASVPFNFDVHAMIFSEDAPKLEAALHRAFESKKLNMINHRREFFAVTLDEIEAVVKKNYDKSVEFIRLAPAEQYRESLKMRT